MASNSWLKALTIDVVHVEQHLAVGALAELGDEFPFGELGGRVGDVARHVLQHQPAAEPVLHPHHPLGDVVQRLLGVGQRQQVVHVDAAQAGEAEMVGDPHRLDPVDQRLQVVEVAASSGSIEPIDSDTPCSAIG